MVAWGRIEGYGGNPPERGDREEATPLGMCAAPGLVELRG